MATHNISIKISPKDVTGLKNQGFSLQVFKVVESSGNGAPTVWYNLNTDKIFTTTNITWSEEYAGYNSDSQIIEKVEIKPGNTIKTELGYLITIEKNSGNLSRNSNGVPKTVAFRNMDNRQFRVGVIESIEGENNITCVFNVPGAGGAKVIKPIPKIAVMFSTAKLTSGVVMKTAVSNGALIDFSEATSRTVQYSLDTGWSAHEAPWIKTFIAFTDLSSLLIQSPSEAEQELERRFRNRKKHPRTKHTS